MEPQPPSSPSRIQDEIVIFNQSFRHEISSEPIQNCPNLTCLESEDEDDPELIELLRTIECPVCKDVPLPPIYNCRNGHFVCDVCRPQLASQACAYCFAEFTQMRNYPLEALVTAPVVKCDFTKYGCSEKRLSLTEYEDHVRHCWAQLWRPGEIKRIPFKKEKLSCMHFDGREGSPCPKCSFYNPPRKLKCSFCDCVLRVPTPMYLPFDYEFESSVSPDLELTLQIL